MHITIRLSCILALLFCLASTGNAGDIDRDRQRIQDLQSLSRRTTDPNARVEITYEMVQIYKDYRGKDQFDSTKEPDLNAGVNNFESKIVLVEGVPKQGGGFGNFFRAAGAAIPDKVKQDATTLALSSAQALIDGICKYFQKNLFGK